MTQFSNQNYVMSQGKKSWEEKSTSSGRLQVHNRRKKKIRRRISCTATRKAANASDISCKKDYQTNLRERQSKRGKDFLNYLRPKLPQAAMPRRERNFYACIMPISNCK